MCYCSFTGKQKLLSIYPCISRKQQLVKIPENNRDCIDAIKTTVIFLVNLWWFEIYCHDANGRLVHLDWKVTATVENTPCH